jgi:DNA damage-inducible protein 1
MLYIPAKVGNVDIKAFVDSGAQTTIMSPDCAQRCGIEHLIDKRYSGIARGVGSAKIVGRVHIANLIVGGQYLPCSFTVIEDQSLDFLLGLDMLKRHSASIDLAKNVLRIPASEAGQQDVEVSFLPEAEIPKRDLEPFDPKAEQTEGTVAGASSGAPQAGAAAGPSSAAGPSGDTAAQQPAAASSSTQQSGPRDQIRQLVDTFGCTEQEAINALRTAGGNIEVAAGILSGFM